MAIFHKEPILFDKAEFSPSSNINNICKTYGIGRIDKVIESTITETTDEYSLELDVHRTCNVFNSLEKFNLILANGQLFRIADTTYDSESQTKNIYAKHISYDLDFDSVYNLKYKDSNKKYSVVFSDIKKASQYTNINLTVNLGRFANETYKEDITSGKVFETLYNVIESFKEQCAESGHIVELEIKRDNNNISLHLFEPNKDYTNSTYKNSAGIGKDTGIRLDISKIEKVEIIEDDDDFCTKVIALGKDDKVVKDITHPELGKAGLPFWITKVVNFSDEANTSKLRKLGQAHIITKSINIKNIKVDLGEVVGTDIFKQLIAHKDLNLYDKIWIKHPDISDTYISFRIVKIERDINGKLKTLELGELTNDFIKTLKKAIKKYS